MDACVTTKPGKADPKVTAEGTSGPFEISHQLSNKEMVPIEKPVGRQKSVFGSERILQYLQELPSYNGQIVHIEKIPAKSAKYAYLPPPALPAALEGRVRQMLGSLRLFEHQAAGIAALRQGRHAVVSTATASGKSLIYNVPVIEAIMRRSSTTALYLFPTKVSIR